MINLSRVASPTSSRSKTVVCLCVMVCIDGVLGVFRIQLRSQRSVRRVAGEKMYKKDRSIHSAGPASETSGA